MQQVKVPKEVMDLVYESKACDDLAQFYGDSFFSFPKAIYFATKAHKANALAHRALGAAHPATLVGVWFIDIVSGIANKKEEPKPPVEKKPRKPRIAKPAVPAVKPEEGEAQ